MIARLAHMDASSAVRTRVMVGKSMVAGRVQAKDGLWMVI